MKYKASFYLIVLLAHVPMILGYIRNMWQKGHYQFFPLLVGVVAYLVYTRLQDGSDEREGDPNPVLDISVGLGLALFAGAALLDSSFLVMPSLCVWLVAFILDRYGIAGILRTAPALLLLVFIIPLPGNLDLSLIQKMQFLASQLASWILDALGQIHFREGVVLVTEKTEFFTEEACSGIRSLFSSLAAIAIYGVIREYPIWRHAFNLVQTVVWVIVGNAIRVALVVYLADNWNQAVAEGTNHEMLGLGVFVLIFVLALSTDRALNAFHFRHTDMLLDEVEVQGKVARQVAKSQPVAKPIGISLLVLVVLLGLFSARLQQVKRTFRFGDVDSMSLMTFRSDDMPPEVNGWNQIGFAYKDQSDAFSPSSYTWTYAKGTERLVVSVDGPYPGYHNLAECYKATGWEVDYRDQYGNGDGDGADQNFTRVDMTKNELEGVVLFTGYDRDGKLVVPVQGDFTANRRLADLWRNVQLAFGMLDPQRDDVLNIYALPITQIQMMYSTDLEITDASTEDVSTIFNRARKTFLNHVTKDGEG